MSKISNEVTSLAVNFLGPATGKFMQRQTSAHMNGLDFEAIEKQHLPELAKWVNISAGLLIGKEKAKTLADKIAAL